jgi:hypothetical protein
MSTALPRSGDIVRECRDGIRRMDSVHPHRWRYDSVARLGPPMRVMFVNNVHAQIMLHDLKVITSWVRWDLDRITS